MGFGSFLDVRRMLPRDLRDTAQDLPSGGSMYREYARLAIPSVMEMVLISLINMVDTVMVSGMGTDSVAAVGLVNQPRMIMLCMFFALNMGITTVIARRRGEERRDDANSTVRTAVMMILALSAVLMAVLLPLTEPLMLFAGAERGRTLAASCEYFRILGYALPFQALSMGLCAAQRGAGNTRLTMRVNITSNLVNVLFNWLLINGIGPFPALGVRGAAIATAIGMVVGFLLSLAAMFQGRDGFLRFSQGDKWRWDNMAAKALTKVASSAMLEQLAMRVGFFSYAKIVAGLGTDAFASHQICCQFMGLSFSFADGCGIAGTSLVGQMLGRKRPDLAHIYGTLARRTSLLLGSLLALCCILLRAPLVSMFIHEADPLVSLLSAVKANAGTASASAATLAAVKTVMGARQVRPMAETVMIVLGIIQPMQMVSVVVSGCLRGAGDVKYTARTSLITIALIRPLGALLGVYIGTAVFHDVGTALALAWFATLLDMIVRVVLYLRRYKGGRWHTIRV